VTTMLLIRDKH